MTTHPRYTTTLVIWTTYDTSEIALVDLAQAATDGDASCAKQRVELVREPAQDPDLPTGFFPLDILDERRE